MFGPRHIYPKSIVSKIQQSQLRLHNVTAIHIVRKILRSVSYFFGVTGFKGPGG